MMPYYLNNPPGSLITVTVFTTIMAFVFDAIYKALLESSAAHRADAQDLLRTKKELMLQQHTAGVQAERSRLSMEIHDTLARSLTIIIILSRNGQNSLRNLNNFSLPEIDNAFNQIHTVARDGLTDVRRFVRDLSPRELGKSSLTEALCKVCSTAMQDSSTLGQLIDIRFYVMGKESQLNIQVEAALLRATQSCLSNIIQHSKASQADITLSYLEEHVALDIYDNGIGLSLEDRNLRNEIENDRGGYGISLLRHRLSLLGGSLSIESSKGYGTIVTVVIPYDVSEVSQKLGELNNEV